MIQWIFAYVAVLICSITFSLAILDEWNSRYYRKKWGDKWHG